MPIINVRLLTKIFIQNGRGEVLVMQRSAADERRPLGWDIPGGNTEQGEDPNEAVLRELTEETGLTCSDSEILCVASENESHHKVTLFYRGHTDGSSVTLSSEHSEYKWVAPSEVAKLDIPEKYSLAASPLRDAQRN